ncbi:alpha/beta fold hydrolase [Planococcus salinarum]|uniref:alpha/beta fold hydrolase n=1 Tax=Planococcus salinarum TaxID=622695 RepID=UPI000E3D76A5|nr:alpha/beta hydrolase [Planococcus salinarum]TAA66567.1 alpha/beta hydrolase [Planococcus salinarum]
MDNLSFQSIETNDVLLHTAVAGPEDGPLVILLHGFPEFWYGWKHQIGALAEQGYRVMAPDQRGYNLSSKPQGAENYTLDDLRDDIAGLIEQSGKEKAVVIGHDWGGAVAWHLAATKPQLVEKLIAINIPHPQAVPRVMKRNPLQWVKSSYMIYFQIPKLPEGMMAAEDFNVMKQAMGGTSRKSAFSGEDFERYGNAWGQPCALTGMLNWYRALPKGSFRQTTNTKVEVPVRILWGVGDQFLSRQLAKESLNFCTAGELVFIGQATHWVHHEQPLIVNRLILEFLDKEKTEAL